MQDIILKFRYALGDTVLLTALVRDLQHTHPGRFRLWALTHWKHVWDNNPHIRLFDNTPTKPSQPLLVPLEYTRGIEASKNAGDQTHFLRWLYKDFSAKTGIRVEPLQPHGELFLTAEEQRSFVDGRYWVVLSGGKLDMTTKHWHVARWQQVVTALRKLGLNFVQVGATHRMHVHPPLQGTLNAVGRTESVRDLFSLIANAEGVICGVTGAMHIAACFNKPCVVIAGGREGPSWEAYSNAYYPHSFGSKCSPVKVEHKYLHTVGLLDCAAEGGCWKSRTVPLDQEDTLAARADKMCKKPDRTDPGQPVPQCMNLITPAHVVEAVMFYYENDMLPPINKPTGKYGQYTDEVVDKPTTVEKLEVVASPLQFIREPTAKGTPQSVIAALPPREHIQSLEGVPEVLQHPAIGGRFTVCVLCYGAYPHLTVRCIDSILKTTPAAAVDLRVACNECCPETIQYLKDQKQITSLRVYPENRLKYPVMWDLFNDAKFPITTSHVIWFDDDSFAVHPRWLTLLADAVVEGHEHNVGLYGWEHLHDFNHYRTAGHDPSAWFRSASWYRGRDWYLGRRANMVAPNGSVIRFVAGGWWCALTEAIRKCGIPDNRLTHHGGDIVVGAQMYQGGYKIKNINQGKKLVFSSGHDPRGASQKAAGKRFPWSPS